MASCILRLWVGLIVALTSVDCNETPQMSRIEDQFDGLQNRLDNIHTSLNGLQSQMGGLNSRFDELQDRFDTESKSRRADTRKLFEKIESFAKLFNLPTELPNLVDRMKTAVESMSTVEQMIEGVNDNIQDVASDMRLVLNGTDTNKIKLNIIIHEMAELKNVSLDLKEASISKNDICSNSNNVRPASCVELYESGNNVSGQYDVYPAGRADPIRVYCDQETDGGGWTVFQRREDGSEDFFREWFVYMYGFGDLDGEFWLGNAYLSILTPTPYHHLRIDIENFDGEKRYAKYDMFQIRPVSENYTLVIDGYSGTAGDSLGYHNRQPFTTKDRDNDQSYWGNCAEQLTGAWWYVDCAVSNLNGQYVGRKEDNHGITWRYWDELNSLKFTEMKFK